jgi:hypothetical protein
VDGSVAEKHVICVANGTISTVLVELRCILTPGFRLFRKMTGDDDILYSTYSTVRTVYVQYSGDWGLANYGSSLGADFSHSHNYKHPSPLPGTEDTVILGLTQSTELLNGIPRMATLMEIHWVNTVYSA